MTPRFKYHGFMSYGTQNGYYCYFWAKNNCVQYLRGEIIKVRKGHWIADDHNHTSAAFKRRKDAAQFLFNLYLIDNL